MALGQILTQSLSHSEHRIGPVRRAPVTQSPSMVSKNINRLISAALTSASFRTLLLSDPVAALAGGCNGEQFHLTPAEYAAVTSLRVSTVRDFAAQLLLILQHPPVDSGGYDQETLADYHYVEVAS